MHQTSTKHMGPLIYELFVKLWDTIVLRGSNIQDSFIISKIDVKFVTFISYDIDTIQITTL